MTVFTFIVVSLVAVNACHFTILNYPFMFAFAHMIIFYHSSIIDPTSLYALFSYAELKLDGCHAVDSYCVG